MKQPSMQPEDRGSSLNREALHNRLYTPSFLIMAFASFSMVSSLASFFLFPLFVTARGGSKIDIGVMMGVMALAAVFCRPWVSLMVDRAGRKRSYTAGSFIMGSAPLAYLLLDGPLTGFYWPLVVLRLFHGIGVALCFTASFTYIADIIPPGRLNEGIGMFGTSGLMGMAVGPLITEPIIHRFGFDVYFLVCAGMGFLSFFLHLPLRETFVYRADERQAGFFEVLRRRKILMVTMLAFLFGIGLAGYGGFVAPFAQALGIEHISVYFVAYTFAAVVTRFFGGRAADRVGEERVVPCALFITGGGLLLLTQLGGHVLLAIAGLVSGCGHGILYPSLNTLALRRERSEVRGKINGIYTGGIDLGIFLGSVLLGWIGEHAGYRAVFAVAGGSLMLGLAVFLSRMRVWLDEPD